MKDSDTWREYRRRRNLSLFALLGYVPFVGIFAMITIRLFGTATPAFVVAFVWMAFAVVAGNWFVRFRCPRCGKPFFAKWWGYNTFARKCLHCKLPLNAPIESEKVNAAPRIEPNE
jgi:hypothetical protein